MPLTLDSQELTTVSKQLADATSSQDVQHILQNVVERQNITQIIATALEAIFSKNYKGSYLINLDTSTVTRITQSSNHTRKVNLYHNGVWLGLYRSAANACRNLGFTIGTDSAKRVLARNGYTIGLVGAQGETVLTNVEESTNPSGETCSITDQQADGAR